MMPWERTPQVDSSWMSAPLERFTRVVIRFPVVTLLLAAVAAAASLWLTTTQLGFRTSRAELLSPNSEYNRRWLAYTKEFGDKEDAVVVVEGANREQIIPALDDVCRELAARKDLFGAVLHQTEAPRLRSKGLYYLEMESPDPRELDLAKIDALLNKAEPILKGDWSALSLGNMTHWMGAALNGGSDEQRRQMLGAMQTELPRVIEGFKAAIGQPDARAWTGPLPSLIRFIVTVGALVGLVYLGMLALVANVKVQPREMTQIVTLPKANP